jgi:ribosome-associated toxin RatA of RatAB toxin-antitoxin module
LPHVAFQTRIDVPIELVWPEMLAVDEFSSYMDSVISVTIDAASATARTCEWKVLLKGSQLEWTEYEEIDHDRHEIRFHQTDGDLHIYTGMWSATPDGSGSVVRLEADFDIGIPLLADMLNPVAVRALQDNQEKMLTRLEERVSGRARDAVR